MCFGGWLFREGFARNSCVYCLLRECSGVCALCRQADGCCRTQVSVTPSREAARSAARVAVVIAVAAVAVAAAVAVVADVVATAVRHRSHFQPKSLRPFRVSIADAPGCDRCAVCAGERSERAPVSLHRVGHRSSSLC